MLLSVGGMALGHHVSQVFHLLTTLSLAHLLRIYLNKIFPRKNLMIRKKQMTMKKKVHHSCVYPNVLGIPH